MRAYAAAYPGEVAGMVLVDIVHEDQRIPMGPKARRVRDFAQGRPIPPPHEEMLLSDRRETNAPLEEAENSQREWSSESMAQMHAKPQAGVLGDIPLIVLTRAEGGYGNDLDVPASELEAERKRTQAELAHLSSKGRQIMVASGHNMNVEAPDQVANAIRAVVDAVRRTR